MKWELRARSFNFNSPKSNSNHLISENQFIPFHSENFHRFLLLSFPFIFLFVLKFPSSLRHFLFVRFFPSPSPYPIISFIVLPYPFSLSSNSLSDSCSSDVSLNSPLFLLSSDSSPLSLSTTVRLAVA